jgi:exodeoxyribonuclease V gamma subunit
LLAGLGEERLEGAAAADLEAQLPWRGEQLVVAHTAKAGPGHRLELWLALLLACAAGQRPSRAVLVARDGASFRILETQQPLPPAEATGRLEQLRQLRERHRRGCWPVPPRTGWAWAEAELRKPGSGLKAAIEAWEGGFGRPAEREDAVMALCFGAQLPTRELLDERCCAAALELLQPVLERRSTEQGGGRRR